MPKIFVKNKNLSICVLCKYFKIKYELRLFLVISMKIFILKFNVNIFDEYFIFRY